MQEAETRKRGQKGGRKLTEKMKIFCREYISNGGRAADAYRAAYNSHSPISANVESTKLLKREDIQGYLRDLTRPIECIAITNAISEREKKRAVLWEIIENGDNNDKCRAMDILNKMDQEYVNINRNIESSAGEVVNLDTETLRQLTGTDV